MQKTKIAIVEDEQDMLDFLKSIINESENMTCINTYKNAEDAITFLPNFDNDIVIVDIGLPGKSGIAVVEELSNKMSETLFVMYTASQGDDNIFESLKAGASGYLLKSADTQKLINALLELIDGGSPMSPSIARKVTNYFNPQRKAKCEVQELLGKKQYMVLDLLSKGLKYKEIAEEMDIVIGTVKSHVNTIYKKLHVTNKTGAIQKKNNGRI